MKLLRDFFGEYPVQTVMVILCLLLASAAEGFSASTLLPLLLVLDEDSSDAGNTLGDQQYMEFFSEYLQVLELDLDFGLLAVLIMVGIVVKSLLVFTSSRWIGYIVAQISTNLRLRLLNEVMNSRWKYFTEQPIGEITNSMATEANRASEAYACGMVMISLGLTALVYLVLAITISWQTTVLTIIAVALIWLLSRIFVKMSYKAGKRQTRLYNSLLTKLTDTLRSVKPLKAMAREDLMRVVLSVETHKLNLALRLAVLSKVILRAVREPLLVLVLLLGFHVTVEFFSMSASASLVFILLVSRIMVCVGKMQNQIQDMAIYESAYWAIRARTKAAAGERESWGGSHRLHLKRSIDFQSVTFSYDDQVILDNFSLRIDANQLTALVGVSGVGKTTVVDLIIGLHRPERGQILIDGIDLGDLDLGAWRSQIGYVPQDSMLLHDSVMNNLTLGDDRVNEEEARNALQAVGMLSAMESLPDGLHSVVGEQGVKLSGGQRQRIMIARALVSRPDLLILDEATTNLDPASEQMILETLCKLRGSHTILAVSHQPALTRVADRVYRIKPGGVERQIA